jgi:hypothetical protein
MMPRGKGVYVDDEDEPGDKKHEAAEGARVDDPTPDVDMPEPGTEPPD